VIEEICRRVDAGLIPTVSLKSDRHLTKEHEPVISELDAKTHNLDEIPELAFLKQVRDLTRLRPSYSPYSFGLGRSCRTERGIGCWHRNMRGICENVPRMIRSSLKSSTFHGRKDS
jgi:hypothetical protein